MKRKSTIMLLCAAVMAFSALGVACGDDKCSHVWGEWSGDCYDGGRTRVCTKCEESEFEAMEHQFGEWYEVEPVTCVIDGEEERMCEVCEMEYETRVVEAQGHVDDGNLYYNRNHHWYVCEDPTCLAEMDENGVEGRVEHNLVDHACTDCEWVDDGYLFWNDADSAESLMISGSESSGKLNIVNFNAYAEEVPEGYEGDIRSFHRIETNKVGNYWAVAPVPALEKSVYEKLQGQGVILTSQIYFEMPADPEAKVPATTFISDLFANSANDPTKPQQDYGYDPSTSAAQYRWDFSLAQWHTLNFSLDKILEKWDNWNSELQQTRYSRGFMMGRGYITDTNSSYTIYWGGFQLVYPDGERVKLEDVGLAEPGDYVFPEPVLPTPDWKEGETQFTWATISAENVENVAFALNGLHGDSRGEVTFEEKDGKAAYRVASTDPATTIQGNGIAIYAEHNLEYYQELLKADANATIKFSFWFDSEVTFDIAGGGGIYNRGAMSAFTANAWNEVSISLQTIVNNWDSFGKGTGSGSWTNTSFLTLYGGKDKDGNPKYNPEVGLYFYIADLRLETTADLETVKANYVDPNVKAE